MPAKKHAFPSFATRLHSAIQEKNSRVCVGLDPRLEWIPQEILQTAQKDHGPTWQAAAAAIIAFNRQVIDTVAPYAAAIKPQFAFYEQYGPAGMQALLETIQYAHEQNLVVIADAKRGDIDSTAQAYASAILGQTELFGKAQSAYNADALTINPFLGQDSWEPFLHASDKFAKGLFILVKTSNPGSKDFQDLVFSKQNQKCTLSQEIARRITELASTRLDAEGYSDVGAVVGATFPEEARELRQLMPHSVFLVPGIGAQGGDIASIAPFFNADGLGAVVNSSRGVVFAFRSESGSEKNYQNRIETAVRTLQKNINQEIGL